LRRAAGLPDIRFHDGRHTALTRLAEAGQPDWVIQAQIGHVSPQMMKTYSHVRRLALDEAAAVLEATFEFAPSAPTAPEAPAEGHVEVAEEVTSQITSQSDDLDAELSEILKEGGSPRWTISATTSSLRHEAMRSRSTSDSRDPPGHEARAARRRIHFPTLGDCCGRMPGSVPAS
jgi:hypothetical protein